MLHDTKLYFEVGSNTEVIYILFFLSIYSQLQMWIDCIYSKVERERGKKFTVKNQKWSCYITRWASYHTHTHLKNIYIKEKEKFLKNIYIERYT